MHAKKLKVEIGSRNNIRRPDSAAKISYISYFGGAVHSAEVKPPNI